MREVFKRDSAYRFPNLKFNGSKLQVENSIQITFESAFKIAIMATPFVTRYSLQVIDQPMRSAMRHSSHNQLAIHFVASRIFSENFGFKKVFTEKLQSKRSRRAFKLRRSMQPCRSQRLFWASCVESYRFSSIAQRRSLSNCLNSSHTKTIDSQ